MYFRMNLKVKKPTLCSCFTWIVFIELNFTVAFLQIRKTWDGRCVSKVGWGMGDFKKWGDPSNGGMGFIPLYKDMNEKNPLKYHHFTQVHQKS